MKVRIACIVAATVFCAPDVRAQQSTQFGTGGEYHWLRQRLSDPTQLAETVAKCQQHIGSVLRMEILAQRTGVSIEELRQTFCQRYYAGLASGRISLREYLHQHKPTRNYVRVLQGR